MRSFTFQFVEEFVEGMGELEFGELQRVEAAKKAAFRTRGFFWFPTMRPPSDWPSPINIEDEISIEFKGSSPTGTIRLANNGLALRIDEFDSTYPYLPLEILCHFSAYSLTFANRYLRELGLALQPRNYTYSIAVEGYNNLPVDYAGLYEGGKLPIINPIFAPNEKNSVRQSARILLPAKQENWDAALKALQNILAEITYKVEGKRIQPLTSGDKTDRLQILPESISGAINQAFSLITVSPF